MYDDFRLFFGGRILVSLQFFCVLRHPVTYKSDITRHFRIHESLSDS